MDAFVIATFQVILIFLTVLTRVPERAGKSHATCVIAS